MHKWAQRVVGGGVVLVVAGAVLALGSAGSASGSGGPLMYVDPASQNVKMSSDPFKVDVLVANVENLGAFEITVTFDKNILEYVGVARGSFLTSTGRRGDCIAPPPGLDGLTSVQNINQNGAIHYGCSTVGVVQPSDGIRGPDGGGKLATLGFKTKATGTADLAFQGLVAGHPFEMRAPRDANDAGEYGQTGMGSVDVCPIEGCNDVADIPTDVQGAVVQVYSPNDPEPTAVPPAPTTVPAAPRGNTRATVEAALGPPERRLDDGTPSVPGSSRGGSSGTGGSAGTSGVAGSSSGGRSTGSINGSSAGGASGAPRAGFGPDPQPVSPWPGRGGVALVLAGTAAIVAGAAGWRQKHA